MRTIADLVIGSDGFLSVWLDHERAMQMAVRMHGVVEDLVGRWEAEQEAKEAYRRGYLEGLAQGSAQCPPVDG